MNGTDPKNLSSRTVTLKRGTVMACISAANKVTLKLAPRMVTKAFPVNAHSWCSWVWNLKFKKNLQTQTCHEYTFVLLWKG